MLFLAYTLSFTSLLLNLSLFVRLKPPYNFMLLWIPQLVQHALSPLLAVAGLAGAFLGWRYGSPVAAVAGTASFILSLSYVARALSPDVVEASMAPVGASSSHATLQTGHAARSSGGRLTRPNDPKLTQDIVFRHVPNSQRDLLCDIWEPGPGQWRSGLGFIFLHGSGWYLSDKDFGTRPFFRHLTEQGHVVMDVAYRLCPEVDIFGMLGDVKHAVNWMKANSATYQVDPDRVVLAGASAGGHLALLAAYAPHDLRLTPIELDDVDLSVCAVVSLYGPTDLRAVYEQTQQQRVVGLPRPEIGLPGSADKQIDMQDAGRLDTLLGGHPDEVGERYDLASPVNHVHPDCPPTLLIHGDLDFITPTSAVRAMYQRLEEEGVPAKLIVYPRTQHAFDLLLPQISPPARSAFAEVRRFLAGVPAFEREAIELPENQPDSAHENVAS